MRVVADASYCAAWVLADESSERAEALLKAVLRNRLSLLVPSLWNYEMLNLLRSAERRGRLSHENARTAADLLVRVPLSAVDVPRDGAARSILRIAREHDLSAYDAAYLELALRVGAPLYSNDQKLIEAAEALGLTPPG